MASTLTQSEFVALKPSELMKWIAACYKGRRPGFIWGPPGVGKSQIVKQVTQQLGIGMIDLRAALLDPVDVRGLPTVTSIGSGKDQVKITEWAVPTFLPQESRDGKRGILFLDELPQAVTLVQGAFLQLTCPPYMVGEYTLPPGWSIIAAGNRETDRAGVNKMITPLANRFAHAEISVDYEEWVKWAMKNDMLQQIVSYIRWKPGSLSDFNSEVKIFPSPRSWEMASDLLKANPPEEIEHVLVAGCVGKGAATEFIAFNRIYASLPTFESIIADPTGIKVPTDASVRYAISGLLASKVDNKNFNKALAFLARMPADFSVLTVKDATNRDHGLLACQAFKDWAVKNRNVII